VRWHRLRHKSATNYLRHGGDIVRLSMAIGHTQITTTQRYFHLLTEDLSASHQCVSILNQLG
jgi:integrase/recombinase XerD